MRLGVAFILLAGMALPPGARATASGEAIALQGISGVVPPCATCHGPQGEGGGEGLYPRVAGMPAAYLRRQLAMFRDGTRASPLMSPMAKGLTDADIAAVADYYSGQAALFPPPPAAGAAQLERGQTLVTVGAWERGVPPCRDCHGPSLQGVAPGMPALAGQWPQYLTAQLESYRAGTRSGDPLGLMGRVARGLNQNDVRDVASYIASLRPGAVPEPPHPATAEAYTPRPQTADSFVPPPDAAIPDGPFGDLVRLGQNIFQDTRRFAPGLAGNLLSCRNCHLDRGRAAASAPMWAAYVHYPEYRKKDNLVNTLQFRIQGCFRFSQNGTPPAADDKALTARGSYFYWMAAGLPVGINPKVASYPPLAEPSQPPSRERGAKVYAANCVLCHGEDGQGRAAGGQQVFPPLWGPQSFNWGAGMHQLDKSAPFIKHNMPLGTGGMLTDQEAWDVAAYMNSQPRPQDPRFTQDVETTRKLYHSGHEHDFYGREVDGRILGAPDAKPK